MPRQIRIEQQDLFFYIFLGNSGLNSIALVGRAPDLKGFLEKRVARRRVSGWVGGWRSPHLT